MDLESIENAMENISEFKDNVLQQITKNLALDSGSKFSHLNSSRRKEKNKLDCYRKGPAPIEESDQLRKSIAKATYGTLDSDLEDLDFEEIRKKNANITNLYHRVRATQSEKGHNLASCRALIVYFSKLAKTKDDDEVIDLNFVASLLENGADINFPDKHGQLVLHEISRGWHPDVAKFAIEHGADVNKADLYGRTPLHLAAAVDYDDMVQFLVDNGADLGAVTNGENQTPMHYAAKNNAAASLKVMLRMGGRINDRDYKRRTPLFVAAESARSEAARFLIEKGAPAGVYDSAGTPCLSLMIEKMPPIAIEAVEQFHSIDLAFRKHYYYLSFLERDPKFLIEFIPKKKSERRELKERQKAQKKLVKEEGGKKKKKLKTYAKSPLEVIVQCDQLDLIMHPVFQRLLHVKWNLFGKLGSAKLLILNFIYTMIWTILGIMMPRGNDSFYSPLASNWWRLAMEIFGVGLAVYFIFSEISQLRATEKQYNCWRQWQTTHMEKDLKYCHPRWPEEEQYLKSELVQIKSYQRTYFRDPWNIFEWIAYIVVLVLIFTRVAAVVSPSAKAREVHTKFYAIGLIVIWLRFMRPCRVFRTLGPFIAILGSVIADTMKFGFLFCEFFVPYTVAFWIIFGGEINGDKMGEYRVNWENFNDLTFSVFSMTIMGPFDWDGLVTTDRLMTQVLCGTYFTLAGVVCMNLYIALLSDTFARVYAQANANAVMQQARCVITLESNLKKFNRSKFGHYMQNECSPQEVYSRDENNDDGDDQDQMFDKVSRQIVNRINELEESFNRKINTMDSHHNDDDDDNSSNKRSSSFVHRGGGGGGGGGSGGIGRNSRDHELKTFLKNQALHNDKTRNDISILLKSLKNIEIMFCNGQSNSNLPMLSSGSNAKDLKPSFLSDNINTAQIMPNSALSTNKLHDKSTKSIASGLLPIASNAPTRSQTLPRKLRHESNNTENYPKNNDPRDYPKNNDPRDYPQNNDPRDYSQNNDPRDYLNNNVMSNNNVSGKMSYSDFYKQPDNISGNKHETGGSETYFPSQKGSYNGSGVLQTDESFEALNQVKQQLERMQKQQDFQFQHQQQLRRQQLQQQNHGYVFPQSSLNAYSSTQNFPTDKYQGKIDIDPNSQITSRSRSGSITSTNESSIYDGQNSDGNSSTRSSSKRRRRKKKRALEIEKQHLLKKSTEIPLEVLKRENRETQEPHNQNRRISQHSLQNDHQNLYQPNSQQHQYPRQQQQLQQGFMNSPLQNPYQQNNPYDVNYALPQSNAGFNTREYPIPMTENM